MKTNLLIAMCFLLSCQLLTAQNARTEFPISKKVEKVLAKEQVTSFTLATEASMDLRSAGVPQEALEKGKILELNTQALNAIVATDISLLSLTFPLPDKQNAKVNLVKSNVLADDFILRQSSNPSGEVDYKPGKYYMGTIEGDPQSLVSFSIFDDEVIGLVHSQNGNFVIGKLENSDKHIIYKDTELKDETQLECGTQDDGVVYKSEDLKVHSTRSAGDCVRVHIEIDDDIVTNKGGTAGATNYITGVMNEVITLYANDGISMIVSEIFAWNTPAPYSGSSSSAMLNSYENNTGSFNGDLSHLVSYQASGGIASGFSGLCNPDVDERKCFSSISGSYSVVPNYSFTVMVMTHEMGHLLGSRHTHACVWNGNGTAIDGCAGGTEGSCSLPGSPSNGGTIMSYCHLTTGIDFTQGFGSQPRAVVLNSIANASCTSSCSGGGPTCTDGTQNGDETGVDCGGSSCPPCNSTCNDNEVNINITFDNYPEETSWVLTNSSGTTVASGGTYGSQPDGSSLTIDACVVDGCYDFTISDAYGDGICCSYGNGSYSVTDGSGSTLASGGSFGSSETTNFCFGGSSPVFGCTDPSAHNYDSNATDDDGSCETCTDGVQNGDETGVDCGGGLCNACPSGSNEIFAHYFESGWDGWADGGSDCYRYSGSRSFEGNYSIRIRDNSGTASSMTSSAYNMSGYTSADIEFYFYANSMENGEDFWVQVNSGSGWQTVATYARGTSFNNNTFYSSTVNVTNLSSNTQFRFRCDASANGDQVYIDQVTLTGNTGSSLVEDIVIINALGELSEEESAGHEMEVELGDNDLLIYPNPVLSELNVLASDEMSQILIYSYDGALVSKINANDDNKKIDISSLSTGFYILRANTSEGWISKKFVKK